MPTNFAWAFNRNLRSPTWQEFYEAFDIKKKKPVLECKHCHEHIVHPLLIGNTSTDEAANRSSAGGTTGMSRHLSSCKSFRRVKGRGSGSMDKFLGSDGGKPSVITKDDVHDKVLRFFISGNIAFNQADNPYFRDLIQLIKVGCNETITVNRTNLTKRLHDKAVLSKDDLMATLMSNESRISLALDCWTSRNKIAFLGIVSVYHPFRVYPLTLTPFVCYILLTSIKALLGIG